MRAIGRDEVQLYSPPRLSEPFPHDLRVMIACVVVMTWGIYLIVFWFVFLWTSPNFGAAWKGTSASGRTATRGSMARSVTKVNGCNALEAHWADRKSDYSLFLCGFLLA